MRRSQIISPGLYPDPVVAAHPFSQNREPNASMRQRETDEDVFGSCGSGESANAIIRRVFPVKKSTLLATLVAAVFIVAPLAPAAYADDMKKDSMASDTMSKDSMKKDSMAKTKKSKGSMNDGMSKDTMSKDNMSKEGMGK